MKSIFYLFIVLLLYSCREADREKDVVAEDNIIHPVVHRIAFKQLLNVDKIGVYDSLSVLINRKTDSIFYVYNSSDFAYRGAWGAQGNGPEDFQFPFF